MIDQLTPTELKIYNVLRDGEFHTATDLKAAWDTFAEDATLQVHIHSLRRKLAPHGQGIATLLNGLVSYQVIRLVRK